MTDPTNIDEKFFAWLDGELSGAEAEAMQARVDSDPELQEMARQHRAMQSRLKDAFDKVASAPVPDSLSASAHGSGPVVVSLAERREQAARRAPRGVPQWAAIAATLVLGVMAGTLVPDRAESPVEVRGDAIYAAGELGRALDTQLASAPSGDVRIGLTFRDNDGTICRTFTGQSASGLACRDSDRWQLRGLFPSGEGQAGDYRMAAGMNPALAALLDSTITGEPLDSAQEAEASKRGWK